jgi:hypothetical protein
MLEAAVDHSPAAVDLRPTGNEAWLRAAGRIAMPSAMSPRDWCPALFREDSGLSHSRMPSALRRRDSRATGSATLQRGLRRTDPPSEAAEGPSVVTRRGRRELGVPITLLPWGLTDAA